MVEKFRRVNWYPDDWLSGTTELSLEEEGAYGRICNLIYSKGRPIPDNDRWLAGSCRVSIRKWRTLRRALIDKEKITVSDGLIHQERCEKELEKAAKRARKQAESGSKGGRKSAELRTKPLGNNDQAQASAAASLKPARATTTATATAYNKKDDDYAFDGVVIRLTWRDFTKWSEAYRAIPDLRSLLQSRDDWLATEASEDDQRRWFISTSNYLANKNDRALAERTASQDDEYDPDFIN